MYLEISIAVGALSLIAGLGIWIRNLQSSNESLKKDMANQVKEMNAQLSGIRESLAYKNKEVENLVSERHYLESERNGLKIRIEEYNKRNDEIISVRLENEKERYRRQNLEEISELENKLLRKENDHMKELNNERVRMIELSKKREEELNNRHKIEIENAKESSRRQALTSNFGRDMQNFLPFIIAPKEGIHHKEVQWVGGTIDAIVFEGLIDENGQEADGEITIRLIEMKTSNDMKRFIDNPSKSYMKSYDPFHAKLSDKQKRIAEAAEAGRFSFEIWAMDSETKETGVFKKHCVSSKLHAAK